MINDLKDDTKQRMNSIQDVEKKVCNAQDKVTNSDKKTGVMF